MASRVVMKPRVCSAVMVQFGSKSPMRPVPTDGAGNPYPAGIPRLRRQAMMIRRQRIWSLPRLSRQWPLVAVTSLARRFPNFPTRRAADGRPFSARKSPSAAVDLLCALLGPSSLRVVQAAGDFTRYHFDYFWD